MRSKGSRFTLGLLGVEGVFARRPQPSPTVRNRSRDPRMAESFLEASNVALLRFAWQACHCVTDVFRKVSKVVLCGRRNTFATFSQDKLQFSCRRCTLDVSSVILRGRRSTLDVLRCVFFLRIALSGLRQVTRCKFRGKAWHSAKCTVWSVECKV